VSILVNPRIAVLSVVESVMRPPPPLDYNTWAEENVKFAPGESPFPGPYRRHTNPPIERILECLGPDHPSRVVSLKASIQIFKTTIAQIFIGASMDLDPGPILYTLPTHDNALRWARTKWAPMRRGSAALKRIFGEVKSRDSTDTTLYQERRDGRGWLQVSGANSEASLAMISVPRQVQDDLAKWDANDAGDSERQADGRSSAFDWAKIFKISSPRVAKTCRISRAYKAGTQERFHVPCPHKECGFYQPLEWANFQGNIDRAHPERAHFTCVSCGGSIEHRDKSEIVARGRWVADNPAAKDVSFYIWRAYSPTRDWESIAREWMAAEGNPSDEQVFFNEVLGLEFERATEAPPWEAIRNRADGLNAEGKNLADASTFERGRVPLGGLIVALGADCQGDRTEVHVKAFGEHLRRWTVDYIVIPHHISSPECRDQLDALLKTTWPDSFGNRRGVDMLAIDGNAYTNDVFGWVKERKHSWTKVIIVRGAKSDHAPPLALTKTERRADGKTKRAQKRFYNVGVSGIKSSLYEHLKKVDALARGYCGYPKGLQDEFYMQLTAESREVVTDRWGYPQAHWQKNRERNEVLDTEVYAEAGAIRCGWYTLTAEQWANKRGALEKQVDTLQVDLFDPANVPSIASTAAYPTKPSTPSKPVSRPRATSSFMR
jgi:phage terminase large subunit GpA-like protein